MIGVIFVWQYYMATEKPFDSETDIDDLWDKELIQNKKISF